MTACVWPLALALTAAAGASTPEVVQLAPGVHLLRGAFVPGSQPDGNTVILRGPDGLLVVDTGRHQAHTRRIIDFAAAEKLPVAAVVNTHWHLDHVGGNVLLRQAFPKARVHASPAIEDATKGFLADYRKSLEREIEKSSDPEAQKRFRAELALIDAGKALFPDEAVAAPGRRRLAGRDVELGLEGGAVTAGDVWLLDRSTRILVAGDLVTLPAPFLDTACPQRWQEALARLAAQDFDRLVPGHGPPLSPKQVASYRAAFDGLLACAASKRTQEECADGWLRELGELVPAEDQRFTRSLLRYYLENHLRAEPAKAQRFCAPAAGR
jgi:glyoxylase-like metal-dependent hydrolase (beta-lactamase superfamily II)